MNVTLIIVADRGGLKVYNVENEAAHLLEFFEVEEAKERLQDQVTDRAGAFPTGGTGGQGNSSGERLTLEAEHEMRSFRKIAKRLMELLDERRPGRWVFAAPSEINGAILDGIPSDYLGHLVENVQADLINLPSQKLILHFKGVAYA